MNVFVSKRSVCDSAGGVLGLLGLLCPDMQSVSDLGCELLEQSNFLYFFFRVLSRFFSINCCKRFESVAP